MHVAVQHVVMSPGSASERTRGARAAVSNRSRSSCCLARLGGGPARRDRIGMSDVRRPEHRQLTRESRAARRAGPGSIARQSATSGVRSGSGGAYVGERHEPARRARAGRAGSSRALPTTGAPTASMWSVTATLRARSVRVVGAARRRSTSRSPATTGAGASCTCTENWSVEHHRLVDAQPVALRAPTATAASTARRVQVGAAAGALVGRGRVDEIRHWGPLVRNVGGYRSTRAGTRDSPVWPRRVPSPCASSTATVPTATSPTTTSSWSPAARRWPPGFDVDLTTRTGRAPRSRSSWRT